MGGPGPCRGRVEVMYAGGWGTVCDDDWDFADARVACREAGCGPALGATGLGHFGYGRGPVLLDNVGCAGTEARLSDCFHLGWGQHNCGHHEDAGALCSGEAWPNGAPRCAIRRARQRSQQGMGGDARSLVLRHRLVLRHQLGKAGTEKWAEPDVGTHCSAGARRCIRWRGRGKTGSEKKAESHVGTQCGAGGVGSVEKWAGPHVSALCGTAA